MVGSVLYAAIATRPDISQAVGVVSKYSSEPTESHLTAVKRILRYLKGTLQSLTKGQKIHHCLDILMQIGLGIWTIDTRRLEICFKWQEDQSAG